MRSLFSFPNPVNDVTARVVATGVVIMAAAFVLTGWIPIVVVLAYGFVARVLTGPTLSPLGQLATRVITPRIAVAPRYVPGPPKRFAQGVGVVFSVSALLLATLANQPTAARWVVGALLVAASLEAFLGLCLGCKAFAIMMRAGVIPERVCEECQNISLRRV